MCSILSFLKRFHSIANTISIPFRTWNKAQALVGGIGVALESDRKHPNSRVSYGFGKIGVFPSQIGLGRRYEVCSTL